MMYKNVIKVKLKGISKPPVWREIEIPLRISFFELHLIIQTAFGFEKLFGWEFEIDKDIISSFNPMTSPCFQEHENYLDPVISMADIVLMNDSKVIYRYDYTSNWVFNIEYKGLKECKDFDFKPKVLKYKGENLNDHMAGNEELLFTRESGDEIEFDIFSVNDNLSKIFEKNMIVFPEEDDIRSHMEDNEFEEEFLNSFSEFENIGEDGKEIDFSEFDELVEEFKRAVISKENMKKNNSPKNKKDSLKVLDFDKESNKIKDDNVIDFLSLSKDRDKDK